MNKLEVEWTGCYPCLCSGEWIIKYNDIELNVPDGVKTTDMNTIGDYTSWSFNEDMLEEFDSYECGLDEYDWINQNRDWTTMMFVEKGIEVTEELLQELFIKIQEEDWRSGSCGGCI